MKKINRFFVIVIQFLLLVDSTRQSYVKQGITTLKTLGKTIKSPLFKQVGNTIKKPIITVFGNTIKNPVNVFRRNTIKNLAYGLHKKQITTKHYFGNKSVKYLGESGIKKFKYAAPQTAKVDMHLVKALCKKNTQMKTVEQMKGKQITSLINMVSKGKPQLPFLFAAGGLNKLTTYNLVTNDKDMDLELKEKTPKGKKKVDLTKPDLNVEQDKDINLKEKIPKEKKNAKPSVKKSKANTSSAIKEDKKLDVKDNSIKSESLDVKDKSTSFEKKVRIAIFDKIKKTEDDLKKQISNTKVDSPEKKGYDKNYDYDGDENIATAEAVMKQAGDIKSDSPEGAGDRTIETATKQAGDIKEESGEIKEESGKIKEESGKIKEESGEIKEESGGKVTRESIEAHMKEAGDRVDFPEEGILGQSERAWPKVNDKKRIFAEFNKNRGRWVTGINEIPEKITRQWPLPKPITKGKYSFETVVVETNKDKTPHIRIKYCSATHTKETIVYAKALCQNSYPKATFELIEDEFNTGEFNFYVGDEQFWSHHLEDASFRDELNDFVMRLKGITEENDSNLNVINQVHQKYKDLIHSKG